MALKDIPTKLTTLRDSLVSAINGKGGSLGSSATLNDCVKSVLSLPLDTFGKAMMNRTATELTIPYGVTKIGNSAFHSFSTLITINMHEGVQGIDQNAFYSCKNLQNINVSEGITYLGTSAFSGCTSLKTVAFKSGLKSLGTYVFNGNTSLYLCDIPSSVTDINGYCFSGCTALSTLICRAATPPTLGGHAFNKCSVLAAIYVPESSVNSYKSATNWSEYADIIKAIGS